MIPEACALVPSLTEFHHAEARLETIWQWVTLDPRRAFWEQRYAADDAGMQVDRHNYLTLNLNNNRTNALSFVFATDLCCLQIPSEGDA